VGQDHRFFASSASASDSVASRRFSPLRILLQRPSSTSNFQRTSRLVPRSLARRSRSLSTPRLAIAATVSRVTPARCLVSVPARRRMRTASASSSGGMFVQQDRVGAHRRCRLHLRQGVGLHHRGLGPRRLGPAPSAPPPREKGEPATAMWVVLDASTRPNSPRRCSGRRRCHGVLLERAHPGFRLAGVQALGFGAGDPRPRIGRSAGDA